VMGNIAKNKKNSPPATVEYTIYKAWRVHFLEGRTFALHACDGVNYKIVVDGKCRKCKAQYDTNTAG
jgi:hypothetical protein